MSAPLLTERFAKEIKGVIECFDRILLTGTYGAVSYPGAMEALLRQRGIQLIDYTKTYANELRLKIASHIRQTAADEGIEIIQVNAGQRKEALVEELLAKRGRREGVVCILGAMESCITYKVGKNRQTGFLQLQSAPGKCQHYYIYLIDPVLGLCHLRIPTWAPFRLQFCFNGHDWLERKLKAEGIRYTKADNCFTHIADFARAQQIADSFDPKEIHPVLDRHAARWIALHKNLGHHLQWSVRQAELSTDIVFKNERVLPGLYQQLVRTAAVEIQCTDIYRFLGKRQPGPRSKAEASSRFQTLIQGTRIKHTLGKTNLKMYDKQNRVLRIECTTSDITQFASYRKVAPRQPSPNKTALNAATHSPNSKAKAGEREFQWAPMRKTFMSLGALREAMGAVNRRYLGVISQWPDRTQERHDLRAITSRVVDAKGRGHRGLDFFREEDLRLITSMMRGENQIRGLTTRSIGRHLPDWKKAKVARGLRRMREHGLLKKVAGTHRYYLTKLGASSLVAARQLTERLVIPSLAAA
jgi:hypothetical protein